jgi:hypothetical protein
MQQLSIVKYTELELLNLEEQKFALTMRIDQIEREILLSSSDELLSTLQTFLVLRYEVDTRIVVLKSLVNSIKES